MHIYFFGFFMMSLQMAGQSAAVALGRSKQAVFFSLFRKVIIVTPLTLLLPHLFGLGVNGVFLAEPISNFIGGGACYITMLLTIWQEMNRRGKGKALGGSPPINLQNGKRTSHKTGCPFWFYSAFSKASMTMCSALMRAYFLSTDSKMCQGA